MAKHTCSVLFPPGAVDAQDSPLLLDWTTALPLQLGLPGAPS